VGDDNLPVPDSKKRSTLAIVDDGLLVAVAVVAALVVLKVIGLVIGTVFFLVKLAAVAGVLFVVARMALRSRGR
jgi:hypothetical protein